MRTKQLKNERSVLLPSMFVCHNASLYDSRYMFLLLALFASISTNMLVNTSFCFGQGGNPPPVLHVCLEKFVVYSQFTYTTRS